MNNKSLNVLKEIYPDFKKYLEEKITINRENFDRALLDVYGLNPDSTASDIIELTETSSRLLRLLRKYHV